MQRLGRYDIESEIGRGGMGIVYRGVDSAIGRTVAIKTIRLTDEEQGSERAQMLRERLLREARAAGTLSHPNIVTIFDLGQEGEISYIVMEFVNGRTLERLIREDVSLRPQERYLPILIDTARALDHAHSRGIVHRDVKPANVMIEDDGTVKIADFGIAKLSFTQTLTDTGSVLGSPNYMAPEQLKAQPVSGRTDQFSLAAIAYNLLTGSKPFEADTIASLFTKILFEEPASAASLNPALGPEAELVLRRGMSKDPLARYGSCTEFVDALRAALQHPAPPDIAGPPVTGELPLPPLPPPPPAPRPVAQRNWGVAIGMGSVLLALVLLILLKRTRPEEIPAAAERASNSSIPAATAPPLPTLPSAGETRVNPADGLEYVWVPAGSFRMGCEDSQANCNPDERPAHDVAMTQGFWMMKTEATAGAYSKFAQAAGRDMPSAPSFNAGWKESDQPIVNVTWSEAKAYCEWAGGDLPTEARWEYAARGSVRSSVGDSAWYWDNAGWSAHRVGLKEPNPQGLHDMLGNVWEWTLDAYGARYYAESSPADPRGPATGNERVLRGGSWANDAAGMRATLRFSADLGQRADYNGFRCVRVSW